MTNEELAIRAKTGDKDCETKLILQLEKWFYKVSGSFFRRYSERCEYSGVTVDDLFQSCYFAMLEAVKAYNPESGYKFITYLGYHIKNAFNGLAGLRTEAQRNNPLNNYTSLDDEISGTDDVTLSDIIPDENAERDFEQAERRVYNQGLSISLDRALSLLPEACETLVRERYYSGKTLSQIADECGVTLQAIRQREQKAFHLLRTGERLRILKAYRDKTIDRYAYRGSLSAWKTSGASATELTAERLERIIGDSLSPKNYNLKINKNSCFYN